MALRFKSLCGLMLLHPTVVSARGACLRRHEQSLSLWQQRRPSLALQAVKRGGGAGDVAISLHKAVAGGLTGSVAGMAQVFMFMWLRTVMNYQYRHGGSTLGVLRLLWAEGKLARLYRGLPFAIVQGPLSRFGSAASNSLVLALRESQSLGLDRYPVFVVTALGSLLTAVYRAAIMPIDTLKTVSQVEGKNGLDALLSAALAGRVSLLYTGAYAMAVSTAVGHYPWFLTFNLLDALIVKPESNALKAARSAAMGFCSSVVSDIVANPIRVIKTTKQASAATNSHSTSYASVIAHVLQSDGITAFFVRGLKTRIVANGLQSIVFTVIWRFLLGE